VAACAKHGHQPVPAEAGAAIQAGVHDKFACTGETVEGGFSGLMKAATFVSRSPRSLYLGIILLSLGVLLVHGGMKFIATSSLTARQFPPSALVHGSIRLLDCFSHRLQFGQPCAFPSNVSAMNYFIAATLQQR